jgi:E1A-binding protein p400
MRIPRSLFDRPSSAILKQRREAKMRKFVDQFSQPIGLPLRPPSMPPKLPEQSEGHPEWLIHEDWALLSVSKTGKIIMIISL